MLLPWALVQVTLFLSVEIFQAPPQHAPVHSTEESCLPSCGLARSFRAQELTLLGCLQFLAAPLPNLLFLRTHVAAEARVHTASEALWVLITESHIQVVSIEPSKLSGPWKSRLILIFYFKLCRSVILHVSMCVGPSCVCRCPRRLTEDVISPKAGVIGSCDPSDLGAGRWDQVILTAEPSLMSPSPAPQGSF